MANETTTTTLTEIVNSEWIRPVFQDYAHEFVNATRFCLHQDLRGRGTSTWAQPRMVSDMGTVGDAGGGVDTEYDATEGTVLTNTQLDLAESTISTSEFGIMRTLTDSAQEDVVDGFALVQAIVMDAARILMTALEDDVVALFGSATNVSGATGVNISVANMSDAITAVRQRGVRAPGGMVGVLDQVQISDLEDAFEATSTSWAVYPQANDRVLRIGAAADNGLSTGEVFSFKGVPIYESGLTDTANTAADVVGAVFVRGDVSSNEPFAALGLATSRDFRSEIDRNAALRADEIVCTMRKGTGILQDDSIEALTTDA